MKVYREIESARWALTTGPTLFLGLLFWVKSLLIQAPPGLTRNRRSRLQRDAALSRYKRDLRDRCDNNPVKSGRVLIHKRHLTKRGRVEALPDR